MGMAPAIFWKLTPWQFYKAYEGYIKRVKEDINNSLYVEWCGEIFARTKKLSAKSLTSFQLKDGPTNKNPSKNIDGNDIKARLKAYQKRLDDGKSS